MILSVILVSFVNGTGGPAKPLKIILALLIRPRSHRCSHRGSGGGRVPIHSTVPSVRTAEGNCSPGSQQWDCFIKNYTRAGVTSSRNLSIGHYAGE